MNYKYEVQNILYDHTNGYLQGIHAEYANNRQMMEDMFEECAFILTNYLLEGKYTLMQFAAIHNELGSIIWSIFKPYIDKGENS